MNKRSLTMVALAAAYTLGSCKKLTAYTDGTGVAMLSIDDEANPDGGGTEQVKKTDTVDANKSIDDAGSGQQMQAQSANAGEQQQAQAENTGQVGGELSAKAETDDTSAVDTSAGTGLASTAIKDPPASEQQQ